MRNSLLQAAAATGKGEVKVGLAAAADSVIRNNRNAKKVSKSSSGGTSWRLFKCRYWRLNADDQLLINQLSQKHSLEELLTIGHRAVFNRVVDFHSNLQEHSITQHDDKQSETLPQTQTKTTAKDLVVLLSAIKSKQYRSSFDRLIPICEVLTALIRDLSVIEVLHLSDVLSSLRLHHQPLAEAIANTLDRRLRLGPNPLIASKPEDNNSYKTGPPAFTAAHFFDFLDVSRRALRGLATQRIKQSPIIAPLCNNLRRSLKNLPWADLPKRDCVIGAEQLAWILNHLAKLDRLDIPRLAPRLNEHLKILAQDGCLSIASYALWGEALLLSEFDKFEVYQKTLLEITIRLTPLLETIDLHVFLDEQSTDKSELQQQHKLRIAHDTHRRLLSCIYGLKYLHHDSYDLLPESTRSALERIQNLDVRPGHPNHLRIKAHLIHVLRRLRIAHYTNVVRGPVMADVLERDRNCVWFCSTSTSFYANSRERTAVHRFQQRLLQAMGYNVASVAFWQWSRLKSLRARLEYVRMARYYALRDRREFDPEFEGWSLPYLDLVSRKAYSVQARGSYFPNRQALGHKEY